MAKSRHNKSARQKGGRPAKANEVAKAKKKNPEGN